VAQEIEVGSDRPERYVLALFRWYGNNAIVDIVLAKMGSESNFIVPTPEALE
jgi:hypothetical protein